MGRTKNLSTKAKTDSARSHEIHQKWLVEEAYSLNELEARARQEWRQAGNQGYTVINRFG